MPRISARRLTAREVAARAGVSVSAVSRTFTAGASVSPATRQRVLAAARELGYRPNLLAQSLMTGRTKLIGLVSNNFDNPAFMEIFDHFTRLLQQRGLRPLLANLSGQTESAAALDMLLQYNVDGVIIASSTLPQSFLEGCRAAGLPVVHAFGRARTARGIAVAGVDNRAGGKLAARTLVERGYRRIAFLGGPEAASSTVDRLSGLCAGLAEHGLAPCEAMFGASYSHETGQALMQQLLGRGSFDAVFCGDDILAIGALDACVAKGIEVPRRIGILGFNDIAMAGWTSYGLTTIRQPLAEIIGAAVEMISGMVEDGRPAVSRRFACSLVERTSLRRKR
ncbi:transcriptional regulator [Aestuariivirga litoralis]|uniref:Transcriptional regulator n=1 Tax=Aestuariivirga litoralis TaxID=2650924 RepID=A0A2W2AQ54_9HYPH|nr:LacI family DNA-binding transcriptional regulator [Aestuariivirga litoralis]PZF77535.1 transcriptional regulator [Aestuariivirga litoralis]